MENSPGDRAAALGRRFAEKQANAPALLPVCPETKRATPSAFLRSASGQPHINFRPGKPGSP